MIRTVVIPQENSLYISIPDTYVGRELEVLLFAKDELEQEKVLPKQSIARFSGILSDKDYHSLKSHTEQARKEWNRDI